MENEAEGLSCPRFPPGSRQNRLLPAHRRLLAPPWPWRAHREARVGQSYLGDRARGFWGSLHLQIGTICSLTAAHEAVSQSKARDCSHVSVPLTSGPVTARIPIPRVGGTT